MKQLRSNLKKGELTLQAENKDDLWYLNTIVEPKDLVKGKTLRKIAQGDKEQRAKDATRRPVFLAIEVEKVEFHPTATSLRISGIVKEGPEDVPLGSHHTFSVEESTIITIVKHKWLRYQLDKVREATEAKPEGILICVLDREEAFFALMKKYGYDLLSSIKGNVQKKGDDSPQKGDFYPLVVKQLKEYDARHNLTTIIIASPAFWKDEVMEKVDDDTLRKKIVKATCSSVGENGIGEVLKRPEVKEALKQDRIAKEMKEVEELFTEISKQGAAAYGVEDVGKAAEAGAVKTLLITDTAIQHAREHNTYTTLERTMKNVDSSKGDITIVSSDHEGGKKLDGLGGIGGILRFKMNY